MGPNGKLKKPTSIRGRDKEWIILCNYLHPEAPPCILNINGGPATGKTLMIEEFCEISGMSYGIVDCVVSIHILEDLLEQVTGKQVNHLRAVSKVAEFRDMLEAKGNDEPCILVFDGIDKLPKTHAQERLLNGIFDLLAGEVHIVLLTQSISYVNTRGDYRVSELFLPQYDKDEIVQILLSKFLTPKQFNRTQLVSLIEVLVKKMVGKTKDLKDYFDHVNRLKLMIEDGKSYKTINMNILKDSTLTEPMRPFTNRFSMNLTKTEMYLILAACIASNNLQKTDYRVFGTMHEVKRRRKSRAPKKPREKTVQQFPLSRLLGLYYGLRNMNEQYQFDPCKQDGREMQCIANLCHIGILSGSLKKSLDVKYKLGVSGAQVLKSPAFRKFFQNLHIPDLLT